MAAGVITPGTYVTDNGKDARVFMIDHASDMPCIGAVYIGRQWTALRWSEAGEVFPGLTTEHALNLARRIGDLPEGTER